MGRGEGATRGTTHLLNAGKSRHILSNSTTICFLKILTPRHAFLSSRHWRRDRNHDAGAQLCSVNTTLEPIMFNLLRCVVVYTLYSTVL